MEPKTKTIPFADNKELIFETGKIARQAHGSCTVRLGDTIIFASACASPKEEQIDFIPLRVDYQEKFFSAGKTLGGFIKREGRPSEKEILTSRLIDRPIRPMFEKGYFDETQVLTYVWSYDGTNLPDPLAICAASCALSLSDIPFIKPIAGVRVGLVKDTFIVNPTKDELEISQLDLLLAGTEDAILMIEGYCDFLTEEQIIDAIATGQKAIAAICHGIGAWQKEIGKPKRRDSLRPIPDEFITKVEEIVKVPLSSAIKIPGKSDREAALKKVKEELFATLFPEGKTEQDYSKIDAASAFKSISSKHMRQIILNENIRPDGRGLKDIRPIFVEPSLIPRAHGSTLFTRGETQSVAVCTLGGENMGQRFEDLNGDGLKRFYLQYFFPPFSVGEVGRMGPAGRREVGHGKLAERSLTPIVPSLEDFPYTIRLESNITESNGSSSMASVCGGCLAMMDAGIPIKRPVSGIAMGLILEEDHFVVLSDILGVEDALGDMDFKISGDAEGITAFQMDIKVEGITLDIMKAALAQAKEGRTHILRKMTEVLAESKKEMSIYAPRIETLQIKPSKIGTVVGPGGKQIRAIIEETGVAIDINDSGLVSIASPDPSSLERAKAIIEGLTGEIEVGKTYHGKVTSVVAFGVFVEVLPGQEGLCHISELSDARVENIFDYIKQGEPISVKVLDINERGQLKLSRKVLLKNRDTNDTDKGTSRPPRRDQSASVEAR